MVALNSTSMALNFAIKLLMIKWVKNYDIKRKKNYHKFYIKILININFFKLFYFFFFNKTSVYSKSVIFGIKNQQLLFWKKLIIITLFLKEILIILLFLKKKCTLFILNVFYLFDINY